MQRFSRRALLAGIGGAVASSVPTRAASARNARVDSIFLAVLLGANQVPPIRSSASGLAVFGLDVAERRVRYHLLVSNVENAVEAHVHKGPPDFNGDVVAYLFRSSEDPVSTTGLLASGTLTEGELIGVLAREGFGSFVEELRAGNLYVNVHTEANPGGEIRGQLRPFG